MPSPFPGMNPYFEAPHIWEDFHASLATEIRNQLTPSLRPRYFAALTVRVAYDEIIIRRPSQSLKPDVTVLKVDNYPRGGPAVATAPVIAPAPLTGFIALQEPIKLYSIELREVESGELVTAIEILSPINKRSGAEAAEEYRRKRNTLLRIGIHLLEIDLLRAGQRWPLLTPLPEAPYFLFLARHGGPRVDVWPVRLQEPLPVIPVPLLEPDPDVPLDLGRAIHTIYDAAGYDIRIDYHWPLPGSALSPEDTEWLNAHLQSLRAATPRRLREPTTEYGNWGDDDPPA